MNEIFVNRCRACAVLQDCPDKMISLFEKKLSEMFTHCTSLEIELNDSLPSHICFECFGHLSNFNKFRQICVNSDALFRQQIIAEAIKEEPPVDQAVDISIKYEVNAVNQDLESELFDAEYIDDDFEQYDPDFTANNDATTSTDDTNSNATDREKYICDYCGQEFTQKSHIGAHMTKHKKAPVQTNFPCTVEGCSKILKSRKTFNNHRLKVHKLKAERVPKAIVEKTVKFSCTQCPKWFTLQLKLDAHVRSYHQGMKAYKCEHCEKEFCKYRSYCSHLRIRYGTDETEKHYCTHDGCDKVYGAHDSLKKHIKRIHMGILPEPVNRKLICEQCGRSFKNGFSLKEHSYKHSGITPFVCKMCPKKFISNYKLKIHTMRHNNVKPFECPTCGLRKTTRKELKYHLNFHSKEITYPCKECSRVFPSYGAINRHVRIHHRNHKPYVCPHCQRAFSKAETMRNHVMTHTGEKPFACSVCGHRFIQSVALKAHMKVHAKK